MTLVIACKSKDGIIVAADSKASCERDEATNSKIVIEDTQKIIDLGKNCVALVYGDGTDDYDAFFDAYKEEAVVYSSYKGVFDYDFCVATLPNFLSQQYSDKLRNTNKAVGVMVVGVTGSNEYGICDMQSKVRQGYDAFYPFDTTTYHYGGMTMYAREYFTENEQIIEMSKNEVAARVKSVIEKTSDMFPDDVNKKIVIKYIDASGIKLLSK